MVHRRTLLGTLRHVVGHATVTIFAVAIALSLPMLAQYILFRWWPQVEGNARLLLLNEISFGALLVVLFNVALGTREGRIGHRLSRLIALAYVRQAGTWLTRRFDHDLLANISGTRELLVMSVTGYDVFVTESRNLQRVINNSFELRVLLMNPYGSGSRRRSQAWADADGVRERCSRECEETIRRLAELAAAGKKVSLKFYDDPPLWHLIFTGDYVWVQFCHGGHELKDQPEYVFTLSKSNPTEGLFPAFYVHFLNNWANQNHPDYDFTSKNLIYRNELGNEVRRRPFRQQGDPPKAGELAFISSS